VRLHHGAACFRIPDAPTNTHRFFPDQRSETMFQEFVHNFTHNLFKPLLLFFYAGFLIPVFRVKFEFPKVLYQSLTIYLLLAIGWHGGEELASLNPQMLGQAAGFMLIGFVANTVIGITAFALLRWWTRLRRIDAATVAGYYGSDSAGTFLTCVGVLSATHIAFAPYMPVMLAVMEIPGCLVALFLVSRLRNAGMDAHGNMPGEPNYRRAEQAAAYSVARRRLIDEERDAEAPARYEDESELEDAELVGAGAGETAANGHARSRGTGWTPARHTAAPRRIPRDGRPADGHSPENDGDSGELSELEREQAERDEADIALEPSDEIQLDRHPARTSAFSREMLHEVFFNPGIYLLFAGIAIGFISRRQGESVTIADDALFVNLFQGVLCLFLLEMGLTASKKLKDLKAAGWPFILFGILAPNLFAATGIVIVHGYSLFLGQPFDIGTYVLFAVLCGAASYIAVPAVQRLAIPEASPTLPLAASLGLTFSYNVTVGIPVYILLAKLITTYVPIYA
jgi:uncharacterized protein